MFGIVANSSKIDTDAISFVNNRILTNAGASVSTAELTNLSVLVKNLKNVGIFTSSKIATLNPVIGKVALAHNKCMFLNDIILNGAFTHDATGAKGDGSTTYARTTYGQNDLGSNCGVFLGSTLPMQGLGNNGANGKVFYNVAGGIIRHYIDSSTTLDHGNKDTSKLIGSGRIDNNVVFTFSSDTPLLFSNIPQIWGNSNLSYFYFNGYLGTSSSGYITCLVVLKNMTATEVAALQKALSVYLARMGRA